MEIPSREVLESGDTEYLLSLVSRFVKARDVHNPEKLFEIASDLLRLKGVVGDWIEKLRVRGKLDGRLETVHRFLSDLSEKAYIAWRASLMPSDPRTDLPRYGEFDSVGLVVG